MKKLLSIVLLMSVFLLVGLSAVTTSYKIVDDNNAPIGLLTLNQYNQTNVFNETNFVDVPIYTTNLVNVYKTNDVYKTNIVNVPVYSTNYVIIPIYQTNIVYVTNNVPNPTNPPVNNLVNIEAESGIITTPFTIQNGAVSQGIETTAVNGGVAKYSFNISTNGNYFIEMLVNAATGGNNSFYVNVDSSPTESMVFDINPITTGFEKRLVSWRGNGTPDLNEINPKLFNLLAGNHTLFIVGRELNTSFDKLSIILTNVVQPPSNILPIVNLTSPANNSAYLSPANVNLAANATDPDGTISKVEFYSNGNILTTISTPPYNFVWNGVLAGNYPIQARAYDNNNTIGVSSSINIVVTNSTPPTNPPTSGGNWYVRSSVQGSNTGRDWNNAWSLNGINWASVQPGDTIWLAGGVYGSGTSFSKSGSAGKYIYIKRATSLDSSAANVAGWLSSFDSQVTITPSGNAPFTWSSSSGLGSYIYIDGRTKNGILAKYDNSANAFLGAAVFTGNGINNVVLTNLDLAGPGGAASFNYQGDNAAVNFRPPGGSSISYITIESCTIRGGPNLIRTVGNMHHIIISRSILKDNASANSAIHANLLYNEQGKEWTVRYCDISGWQVEGIILWDVGTSANWYVYGNVFHDPGTSVSSAFWPGSNTSNAPQGPLYLYNNTFVGVSITTPQSRSWQFAPGSVARNNIYWSSSWAANSVISDSNYNFSNGTTPGANSINGGSNPFVNEVNNDFRIVNTVGTKYPKDKGVNLSSPYNQNSDGTLRGQDGFFDIGAFESQ